MKLTFYREQHPIIPMTRVLPRIEITPDETEKGEGWTKVSLARAAGSTRCVYSLMFFAQHDYDAPNWTIEGAAPPTSTDPSATATLYMARIKKEIEALVGHEIEMVVVDGSPPDSDLENGPEDSGDKPKDMGQLPAPQQGPLPKKGPGANGNGNDDWKKYGVQ